mmetsp:Transcript_5307/g.6316  ORF Transcript_5307/g.6316 Transcript_5307/m.6316 type:complete len:413 (-) Transcript_5307:61-1299(-)
MRIQNPDFTKAKLIMRNELNNLFVYLLCSLEIISRVFFENSVINPQVNISLPKSLFLSRWDVGNSLFIDLSCSIEILGALLETSVVKPDVIVQRVFGNLLFVKAPSFVDDDILHLLKSTVLLFKLDECIVKSRCFCFRDPIKSVLEQYSCSFELFAFDFESSKREEEVFLQAGLSELSECSFIIKPCSFPIIHFLLKSGCFQIPRDSVRSLLVADVGRGVDEPLKDLPAVLDVIHALFELKVSVPGLILGVPCEPALKDLPDLIVVADDLFHISVLQPELVDSRKQLARAFPDVPRVVDVLVLHFHLCVPQPQPDVLVVDLEGSFEDRPGSAELLEASLPLCVLHPVADVVGLPPDAVFELLPRSVLVVVELFRVGDALNRREGLVLSVGLRFGQQLLGRDLDCRRVFVLDL